MRRHSWSISTAALIIFLSPALAAAQELKCGETLRRTIEHRYDFVSFEARAGEVVSITVAAVTDPPQDPNFAPEFQIEDPDGEVVFFTFGDREYRCPSVVHQCETMPLPLDGSYTLIVNDNGKRQDGTYAVTLEAVSQTANGEWNGPPNPQAPSAPACQRSSPAGKADGTQVIARDAPVGGVIDDQGETDTFTFDGTVGESIVIELNVLAAPGGPFMPRARLFDPLGQPLGDECVVGEPCTRGPLAADGGYTIKVYDLEYVSTGDYTLLLRAPGVLTTTTTTTLVPPSTSTTTTTLIPPMDDAPAYELSRTLRRTPGLTPPEELGAALAAEPGTLLIGTPVDQTRGRNAGAVYVMDITGTPGNGTYGTLDRALFKPGGSSEADRFGAAVALLGGAPVVGAPGADVSPPNGVVPDAGAVYAFAGDGSSTTIIQPQPVSGSEFGAALAVAGEELFVGAPGPDVAGRVFVFVGGSVTGDFQASDWGETPQSGDHFGFAIASRGDWLAIGAPGDATRAGRVFLVDRFTSALHVVSSPDAAAGDRFGAALTFVDSTLVVGAPGASRVFTVRDPSAPTAVEIGPPGVTGLGTTLAALDGDVLVGAPAAGLAAGGMVLRLDLEGAEVGRFAKTAPVAGDRYGAAIAVTGNQVMIGVPGDDSGNVDAGAVYAYRAAIAIEEAIFRKRVVEAQFGASIAADDDVISVGAPTDVGGDGAVYSFSALPVPCAGDCPSLDAFAGPAGAASRFGQSVALADGVTVVGAPTDGDVGAVHLVQLGTSQRGRVPNPELPPLAGDQFGLAVATVGDDLLVGAPLLGSTDTGAVFVFAAQSLRRRLTLRNPVAITGDFFGAAVAAEGDTIAVGAPFDSTAAGKAGATYLFQRATGELLEGKPLVSPTAREGELFGASVAISPTLIAVGAPGENQEQLGRVYVFDRQSRALVRTIDNADVSSPGDRFGAAVAIIGGRILVGAPFADSPIAVETGAAYLFDAGNGARVQIFGNPEQGAFDHFGLSLAAGPTGPIIGAPTPGRVFVYTPAEPAEGLAVRSALAVPASLIGAAAAAPACGNGVPEGGEQCDDGNSVDTDDCRNDCTARCCVIDPLAAGRCNDFDPCTDDRFDAGTGRCVNTSNGQCCTSDASCAGQDDVCRLCAGCSLFPWDCCDQGSTCLLSSPECADLDCFERPVCECQGGLTCSDGTSGPAEAINEPFVAACAALSSGANVSSADNPLQAARTLNREARQALKATRRATKQAYRDGTISKTCRREYLDTTNLVMHSIRGGNKLRRCVREQVAAD